MCQTISEKNKTAMTFINILYVSKRKYNSSVFYFVFKSLLSGVTMLLSRTFLSSYFSMSFKSFLLHHKLIKKMSLNFTHSLTRFFDFVKQMECFLNSSTFGNHKYHVVCFWSNYKKNASLYPTRHKKPLIRDISSSS